MPDYRLELEKLYDEIEKKIILNYAKLLKENLWKGKPNLCLAEVSSIVDRTTIEVLRRL